MASTFGKSFGKSFNIGLQQAMQSARDDAREERLSERMKEEKEATLGETLLKELGATGADVSSFRRNDGGIYREAAEMELAEAQRQAIAGRAAAYSSTGGGIGVLAGPSEGAGASEGAYHKAFAAGQSERGVEAARDIAQNERLQKAQQKERDRIEAEQTRLVSRRLEYANFPIDFEGDWRSDTAKIDAFNAFRLRQAQSGAPLPRLETEVRDLSADSFNPGTGVMKSAPFIIPTVTPEMEGELAGFQRKKAAETLKAERQATVDFNNEQAGFLSKAAFEALTPSAKNMFSRLYGGETITADPTTLAAQVAQAADEDRKEYSRLDERAKTNISFININSRLIPLDSSFSFKFNKDGSPDESSINEFNQRYRVEKDSFGNEKRVWFYGKLVPPNEGTIDDPLNLGLPTTNPEDNASGGALNPLDLTPKNRLGVKEKKVEQQWGEEEKKLVDFWESNNTSSEMVGAAKSVFDAIPSPKVINPTALYGQAPNEGALFSSPQGSRYYTSRGQNNIQVQQIAPRLGDLRDIDPSKESLFGAAISKLNEEDTLIKWKVEDSRDKTLELRKWMKSVPTDASMSGRDSLLKARQAQEQKINASIKEEVDGVKTSMMYRNLRNDLIDARVKEVTSTYKGISKKEAEEYVRDEEIKATLRGEEGRATQFGGGKSAKGEQRMREAISSKFRW